MARLKGNPWAVLAAMCLGFFMILLDTTIVMIAIPAISSDLSASLDDILWIQSGYVLVYAVLLITAGRLGDMYGPRRLFLIGLVIFVLSSAACGLARNPDQLIMARVVQGVGGALLTPQTLSIITRIFPPEKRGAAFGIWGAVAGVAAVAGPTLGGLLITYASWEWIFYLNVPIGIVAVALTLWVVPAGTQYRHHHLDIVGVTLASLGLFGITYGLIEGEPHHWGTVWHFVTIPLIIGAGAALLVTFLVTQYFEKREPLVPLAILGNRNFSLMCLVSLAMAFGMLGIFLPLTIYLQSVLGLSALQAGLTMAPTALVSIFVAPAAGKLVDKIGGKYILLAGLALFAAGMAYVLAVSHVDSGRWAFLPGLVIAGFGMGSIFAPMTTVAMQDIEPRLSGAASGVFNTMRQLGAVVGTAAVGAMLEAQLSATLADSARAHAHLVPQPYRQRFVEAFADTSGSVTVGGGQVGSTIPAQLRRVALDTFHTGFVNAMRPTLLLPIAVLCVAAIGCLFIKQGKRSPAETETPEPAEAPPAG